MVTGALYTTAFPNRHLSFKYSLNLKLRHLHSWVVNRYSFFWCCKTKVQVFHLIFAPIQLKCWLLKWILKFFTFVPTLWFNAPIIIAWNFRKFCGSCEDFYVLIKPGFQPLFPAKYQIRRKVSYKDLFLLYYAWHFLASKDFWFSPFLFLSQHLISKLLDQTNIIRKWILI